MKKIFTFTLVALLLFNARIGNANAVWSNVASDVAIRISEEMAIEIRIIINATAKMFAIKQVQSTIQSSLAGASDSPKYIKNYRDFLINNPREEAKVVANDFLTATLQGRTSGGGYVSANMTGTEEGISANMTYSDYLENSVKAVIEGNSEGVKVTIEDICNPLEKNGGIFAQGDWDCFSEMMDNQLNLPVGLSIATEGYLNQKTAEYQLEAKAIADSSEGGFLPIIDVNGNVTLPAGITADLQAKIVTLPIDSIANSDSEAFSTLIESFAVSTISEVVQYGLGETERSYRNTSNKFSSRINASYSDKLGEQGPEVMFNADLLWR